MTWQNLPGPKVGAGGEYFLPFGRLLVLALSFGAAAPMPAVAQAVSIYYSPGENLEHIDLSLLRSARVSIDFAGYVVTDWPVAEELVRAAGRGVRVRVVLDPSAKHAADKLAPLGAQVRQKARGALMHLKSYAVDGSTLRTGSANFSPSGLKRQNNDLVVIRDAQAVERFQAEFEALWRAAAPYAPAAGDGR